MSEQKKFYQLNQTERLAKLVSEERLPKDTATFFSQQIGLPEEIANHLSENQIGFTILPMGVLHKININGKEYCVPMTTEEPSVVAAANNGAQLGNHSGGFKATYDNQGLAGQIILTEVMDQMAAIQTIKLADTRLKKIAAQAYPSIVKRGGGVQKIETIIQENYLVIEVTVDTCDAMGANMINTILEQLTPEITRLVGGHCLMSILSNATASTATATVNIGYDWLQANGFSGEEVANRIASASSFAKVNVQRAVTHNKGIMNGIDAVALATGNDNRAIATAIQAYAGHTGHYCGLSTWNTDPENQRLIGSMTIPLHVATAGGGISILASAQAALALLGKPSAPTLAMIMASVGLAQNLAALKALVTTGIQAGHMRLQLKTLALKYGATESELPILIDLLLKAPIRDSQTVKKLLIELRKGAINESRN